MDFGWSFLILRSYFFILFFSLFLWSWLTVSQTLSLMNAPYIAPASSLWSRKYNFLGGTNGIENFSTHFQFNLFGSLGWEQQPTEKDSMFYARSYFTSTVYQDFLFIFGDVPGLEIKNLGPFLEHELFNGAGPVARIGHTSTWYNHSLYLFGGYDESTGQFLNDFWRADLEAQSLGWELMEIDSPMYARAFHTAVLYEDSIYFYGGTNESTVFGDIWRYDLKPRCWAKVYHPQYAPPPRAGHSAVYWATEAMYIWGGYNNFGLRNDMWKFDFQEEQWEPVPQGETVPSPRAFFGYTVIDSQFITFAGEIESSKPAALYWSPEIFLNNLNQDNCSEPTGFISIPNPTEFSGEVWSYDFCKRFWTLIGCLPPFNESDPQGCRSYQQIPCPNNCSGNGVCIQGVCYCRGNWNGTDCSNNSCQYYQGFKAEIVDRALFGETLVRLGRGLIDLKSRLENIQERLPSYDEITSCNKDNIPISKGLIDAVSMYGINFYEDCLAEELIPFLKELNQVLELSNKNAI